MFYDDAYDSRWWLIQRGAEFKNNKENNQLDATIGSLLKFQY